MICVSKLGTISIWHFPFQINRLKSKVTGGMQGVHFTSIYSISASHAKENVQSEENECGLVLTNRGESGFSVFILWSSLVNPHVSSSPLEISISFIVAWIAVRAESSNWNNSFGTCKVPAPTEPWPRQAFNEEVRATASAAPSADVILPRMRSPKVHWKEEAQEAIITLCASMSASESKKSRAICQWWTPPQEVKIALRVMKSAGIVQRICPKNFMANFQQRPCAKALVIAFKLMVSGWRCFFDISIHMCKAFCHRTFFS